MMKRVLSLLMLVLSLPAYAWAADPLINVRSYATTNATTSAYSTLVASVPVSVGQLMICDTSTKVLKIATGESGSEVDLIAFTAGDSFGGFRCIVVSTYIAKGTRLSIRAIDGNATTGYNLLSYLR